MSGDLGGLFCEGRPDNQTLERRLCWLVGVNMRGRGPELSRRLGVDRQTLSAYGDGRPLPLRADGRMGRRLQTLMRIMEALELDWLAANLAAASASSPEEMVRLAADYGRVWRDLQGLRRDAHDAS